MGSKTNRTYGYGNFLMKQKQKLFLSLTILYYVSVAQSILKDSKQLLAQKYL